MSAGVGPTHIMARIIYYENKQFNIKNRVSIINIFFTSVI